MVRNGLSPAEPWSGCQAWRKHSTSFSTTGFGVAGLTFSTRWASLRERCRNPGSMVSAGRGFGGPPGSSELPAVALWRACAAFPDHDRSRLVRWLLVTETQERFGDAAGTSAENKSKIYHSLRGGGDRQRMGPAGPAPKTRKTRR